VGAVGRCLGRVHKWVDDVIVDGIFVNGWGWLASRWAPVFERFSLVLFKTICWLAAVGVGVLLLWIAGVLG
jgi:hypothetical protein